MMLVKSRIGILWLIIAAMAIMACGGGSVVDDDTTTPDDKNEKPTPIIKDVYKLPSTSSDTQFKIAGNVMVTLDVKEEGLVRNPAMGWVLYDDANDPVANASEYWMEMDKYAKYASIFYVRWRWSDLEPAEGEYVW